MEIEKRAEVLTCPLLASDEKSGSGPGTGETPTSGPCPVKIDDVAGVAELYGTVVVRVTVMVPMMTVDVESAAVAASGKSGRRYRYIVSMIKGMPKEQCREMYKGGTKRLSIGRWFAGKS